MISRYLGGRKGLARAALVATTLLSAAVWADGPRYTYLGASYEWTDVKYAVDPSQDPNFNFGTIEGFNIDASLGILSWWHVYGQYFSGACDSCGNWVNNQTNERVVYDPRFQGYKLGTGFNLGFDLIGLNEDTDFILRFNYLDMEMNKIAKDSGWSIEFAVRSQISERAEVYAGYEIQQVGSGVDEISNRDLIVGLGYEVWGGLTLTADAIVFDSETGFALGLRWYFGDLIFNGRDSIVR